MASILIIDDEDSYYDLCTRYLPEHTFLPPARNYAEVDQVLRHKAASIDLVLLDVHFDLPEEQLLPRDKTAIIAKLGHKRAIERLRRSQGLRILDAIRQAYPDLRLIVMTSREDLPLEADAQRLHAEDYTYLHDEEYLDARSLKLLIDGVLAQRRVDPEAGEGPFFWGGTPRMQQLRRRLSILARGRLPVIIQGATGTGKSLVAREYIHPHSGRTGPFVAVDLSTIPTELMAAHLFGVTKGAYTGATSSRAGVLEQAHHGTLFLDEIGNLSLELQKSLLLLLQDGRYRAVGSVKERVADIKLVVATNENLASLVRAGQFREDLFMRLNPATAVTLPGLGERRDDFDTLLTFFVRRVASEAYNRDLLLQYAHQRQLKIPPGEDVPVTVGRSVPARLDPGRVHLLLHANSLNLLREFSWPGNFRQFEMTLSNLLTFTLVELVERAEQVEPDAGGGSVRADVVPIPAKVVIDLLRPMAELHSEQADAESEDVVGPRSVRVDVPEGSSLNAVSCAVERQYLETLYLRHGGDLATLAEVLLGDVSAGRKVQIRMNQLGIKLRSLKRRRSGGL